MNYQEALEKIIVDGIEAAKRDYKRADQKSLLEGSVAGFEACRDKTPAELSTLLEDARGKCFEIFSRRPDLSDTEIAEYKKARGYELEVEWVCNVISALLANEGKQIIVPPTARGALQAAKVVGVKEST